MRKVKKEDKEDRKQWVKRKDEDRVGKLEMMQRSGWK